MDNLNDPTLVTAVVSYFVSAGIEWLKRSDLAIFRWINVTTPVVNRIMALIFATAQAAGVHWTYDSATGAFALAGTVGELQHFAFEWARAWVAQKAWYKFLIKG